MKQDMRGIKDFLSNTYLCDDVMLGVEYWQKILLNKAITVFGYENLPSTLSSSIIETMLITKGYSVLVRKEGKIWCPFDGSVYGFDTNGVPNQWLYANPRIGSGRGYDLIDNMGCIGWNSDIDMTMRGGCSVTYETIMRYSSLLAQNESSLYNGLINERKGVQGVASDETTATNMANALANMRVGKMDTIVKTNMLGGLEVFDYSNRVCNLTQMTETRDYFLNCFYNEIGVQTLEEKKERMIVDELHTDEQVLDHNLQSMYTQRVDLVAKMNFIFADILKRPIKLKMMI